MQQDALEYIQQLEAARPKWISVEERLPDGSKDVLCIWDGEIILADFENDTAGAANGDKINLWRMKNEITHWMPLPETPEVE